MSRLPGLPDRWTCPGCRNELPLRLTVCPECGGKMPNSVRNRIYRGVLRGQKEYFRQIDFKKSVSRCAGADRIMKRLAVFFAILMIALLVGGGKILLGRSSEAAIEGTERFLTDAAEKTVRVSEALAASASRFRTAADRTGERFGQSFSLIGESLKETGADIGYRMSVLGERAAELAKALPSRIDRSQTEKMNERMNEVIEHAFR